MKLKEWNALNEETRHKLASIVFALEGEDKIDAMSRIWRHNIDDNHRKLLNAISIKDNLYSIKFLVDLN